MVVVVVLGFVAVVVRSRISRSDRRVIKPTIRCPTFGGGGEFSIEFFAIATAANAIAIGTPTSPGRRPASDSSEGSRKARFFGGCWRSHLDGNVE